MYMARSDSIMIGLLAVAQLMLWQFLQDEGVEAVAEIFGVTGGTTALLAIYFLTSVGKYQKEFNDSYSKLEKTRLDRNDQGRVERVDDRTVVNRAGWWSVPVILMIIGSMNVLGSIITS
jgi:hypothetical protein